MKSNTPESGVLRACLDLLAAERIWHMRMNTGAMSGAHKGKRWFVRYGIPGAADILATPLIRDEGAPHGWFEDILLLWIECKSDSGKQSDAQKGFEASIRLVGHYYLLVRDPDTLKNWLIEHGCMRAK